MNKFVNFLKTVFTNQLFLILVAIVIIALTKNTFDYEEYEKQWMHILEGGNPWEAWSNVYGPAHNLMAFVYAIHHKLPRLIFGLGSLLISLYLYRRIQDNPSIDSKNKTSLLLLAYFNPIIWIFLVVNGCNDGLIGLLFITSILYYGREKFLLAALLLSIATLYKYIPIYILPFLFISSNRINWKFALSFSLITVLGMLIAYLSWGETLFNPIRYNSHRLSKILSIFRFLRGEYSPFQMVGLENLDFLSTYLLIIAGLGLFALHLWYKMHWYHGVLLAMLSLHLFYMVGHFQYYIIILLLFLFYLNKDWNQIKTLYPDLLRYIWLFIGWICFATILYAATEGFYRHFEFIREIIGLPSFIINGLLLWHMYKYVQIIYSKRRLIK